MLGKYGRGGVSLRSRAQSGKGSYLQGRANDYRQSQRGMGAQYTSPQQSFQTPFQSPFQTPKKTGNVLTPEQEKKRKLEEQAKQFNLSGFSIDLGGLVA